MSYCKKISCLAAIFSFIVFLSGSPVWAQYKLSKKGGFLFPIKPGKPNSLTGNMGELRSNHFHGGLDIRTGWASGLPVYCAKDGWVSRVVIAGEGYGNLIFVTHPDGFVTLYAHLERLSQPLHDFIKQKQYDQRSFDVDVVLPKNQFRVKQGDTLAISGNTGSSRGPHLHFEIRDTNNVVYNPLTFGFEEIVDKLAPVFERLAIVPLDINSRINGKYERQEILLRVLGSEFVAVSTPVISGTVGLEMISFDRISNGTSHAGVFCTEMLQDERLVYFHNLNQFPFEKSGHINHYMNYRVFRMTGEKFQKLYSPDGYFQQELLQKHHQGRLHVAPGTESKIDIWLFDEKGNKRKCKLKLKGEQALNAVPVNGLRPTKATYDVLENTLVIKTNGQTDTAAFLYHKGKKSEIALSLVDGDKSVYLHDLRRFLPDSFVVGNTAKLSFAFKATVVPKSGGQVNLPGINISISEKALFDTLYLEAETDDKGALRINSSVVALAGPLSVNRKFDPCGQEGIPTWKAYAETVNGSFKRPLYSECMDGGLNYFSKYLGKSQLLKDTIPPIIKAGLVNAMNARFNIYDNLSGIDKIEATVNGQWVLMVFDKKNHIIYSEPWPRQLPMKGEFKLRVSDKAGNVKEFVKKL